MTPSQNHFISKVSFVIILNILPFSYLLNHFGSDDLQFLSDLLNVSSFGIDSLIECGRFRIMAIGEKFGDILMRMISERIKSFSIAKPLT
jgi:hypothetical protein